MTYKKTGNEKVRLLEIIYTKAESIVGVCMCVYVHWTVIML